MKLYGEIIKTIANDDGTLTVSGICSTESVDSDGEVILSSAIQEAIPEYLRWGAVREMHDNKACGTAISMRVENDKTFFEALIVDPIAVKKINTNVYKGWSIGGKVTKRNEKNKNIIEALKLVEVSLVDRPANPESVFTMIKFEDSEPTKAPKDVHQNSAKIIKEEKPMPKTEEMKPEVEKEMPSEQGQDKKDPAMMMKEAYMHIAKAMELFKQCGLEAEEKKAEEIKEEPKEETKEEPKEDAVAYSQKVTFKKSESFIALEKENKELKDTLEKKNAEMQNLLNETTKTLKAFETKGYLKAVAVSKSEDTGTTQEKENAPKNAIEALKKMYSQGGQPFGYKF